MLPFEWIQEPPDLTPLQNLDGIETEVDNDSYVLVSETPGCFNIGTGLDIRTNLKLSTLLIQVKLIAP